MNERNRRKLEARRVRDYAEKMVSTTRTDITEMSAEDVQRLVHELQIHQIELEMQNQELRETQLALAKTRDRYSDLYEFAPVGYLSVNHQGVIREANSTAADLLKKERPSLIGRKLSEFVARASQDILYHTWREAMDSRVRTSCDLRMSGQDGPGIVAQLDIVARGVEDADSGEWEIAEVHVALIDVTARHNAEEEVRHLNEKLEHRVAERTKALRTLNDQLRRTQFTVDRSQDAIFWIRSDGSFLFVNDAACLLSGYERDKLLYLSVTDIDEDLTALTWPAYWKAISTDGPVLVEHSLRTSDGRSVPVELSATHLRFDHQNFVCIYIRDISERRQAEEELLGMGRIIKKSLNEIYVFEAESLKFLLVNRGARENLGYSIEEIRALTPVELTPEYSRGAFLQRIEPLRAGDADTIIFETSHRRKDGSSYNVEIHLQRTRFRGVECFLAVVLDITRRIEAEAARRETEERLRAILNAAADSIITIDSAGLIVAVNGTTAEMFGYAESELIGQNVSVLMPSSYGEHHDGYIARYQETGDARIIGTGREVVGRRKDGSTFPAELAVSEVKDMGLFTGIVRDITDRKEGEEALRALYEFNENLIETAQNIVLVLDSDGRILRFNPALEKFSGWSLAEAEGRDWFEMFLPSRDRERVRQLFGKAVNGERTRGNVNAIVTKSGNERQIEWYDSRLKDADGNLIGLLCIGIDVTERLRLEEEVVNAVEEERQRIACELHDDLGSLLTGIDFHVAALTKILSKNVEDGAVVERCEMIRQLLIDATRKTKTIAHELHPVGTHPDDLMCALNVLSEHTRNSSELNCQFRCPDPVPIDIPIFANHLFRIAQEAVNNAVKYCGGSQIAISLENTGDEIVLSITDDGGGIDLRPGRRTGSGMETIRYRAAAMGGSLAVGPGNRGGTNVVCTIPADRMRPQ